MPESYTHGVCKLRWSQVGYPLADAQVQLAVDATALFVVLHDGLRVPAC